MLTKCEYYLFVHISKLAVNLVSQVYEGLVVAIMQSLDVNCEILLPVLHVVLHNLVYSDKMC